MTLHSMWNVILATTWVIHGEDVDEVLDQLLLEWDVTTEESSSVSLIMARWLADYPFYPGELNPERA